MSNKIQMNHESIKVYFKKMNFKKEKINCNIEEMSTGSVDEVIKDYAAK